MLLHIILIAVPVLIIPFFIIVAMRPNEFRVTRSAVLPAAPETLFDQVNHVRKWEAWSPWEKKDLTMTKTYDGPPAGVGAHSHWAGNKVGEGMMTITESRPNERIRIKLEFLKPFKATNDTEFTFKSEGNGTRVTWTMSGRYIFITKIFSLFMNMDKMIGTDFEIGLAQLGTVTRQPAEI